jgi:signal peptidase
VSSGLGRTKKIVIWTLSLALAVILAAFIFVHFSPGHDMRLVRSESMKPAINMGDLVITGPVGGLFIGAIEEGDIVTYRRGDELVTHRVISIEGDTLVTQGDAVEDPDPWPVTLSDVSGVYMLKIPYLGYLANFVRTKFGWFLVIILPAIALVALFVRDIFKELRRRSKNAKEVLSKNESGQKNVG